MMKTPCDRCIDKLSKEQKEELRQEMLRRLKIMEETVQRAIDMEKNLNIG